MTQRWSWDEMAVMEAAARALTKAKQGRRFDEDTFRAVAEHELGKLRQELTPSRTSDCSATGQARSRRGPGKPAPAGD